MAKFGTVKRTRHLLIHTTVLKLGDAECLKIFKAHILTGSGGTTKIGTKQAVLKAKPENYLHDFRKAKEPSTEIFITVESFLVQVLSHYSKSQFFNDLRYYFYS